MRQVTPCPLGWGSSGSEYWLVSLFIRTPDLGFSGRGSKTWGLG